VVKHAGQRAGIVVDTLLGEFQTVIKPLGKMFQNIKSISGSTILGSGEIALILDVPSLVQHACLIDGRGTITKNVEGGLLTAYEASR
jgi:two-component system chemotaxis sensor kinase CheA